MRVFNIAYIAAGSLAEGSVVAQGRGHQMGVAVPPRKGQPNLVVGFGFGEFNRFILVRLATTSACSRQGLRAPETAHAIEKSTHCVHRQEVQDRWDDNGMTGEDTH